VAVDADGQVVGVSVVLVSDDGATGFVDRLAVRRDQRNRGLAQALLVDSFAQARAHGATTSELSTDSRTGALGLYERVGMVTTSVWVNRGIDLKATVD
jgi:ribosomal protein S18 acetylase RimI-like enzyme